jgi:hypothetical protein
LDLNIVKSVQKIAEAAVQLLDGARCKFFKMITRNYAPHEGRWAFLAGDHIDCGKDALQQLLRQSEI